MEAYIYSFMIIEVCKEIMISLFKVFLKSKQKANEKVLVNN